MTCNILRVVKSNVRSFFVQIFRFALGSLEVTYRFLKCLFCHWSQGLILLSFVKFIWLNDRELYSRDFQDIFVDFIFNKMYSHKSLELRPTFLELGADDGIFKSNCIYLEKLGWQGVAIEANPIQSDALARNRNCIVINRAIWHKDSEVIFSVNIDHPSRSHIRDFDSYSSKFLGLKNSIDLEVDSITPKQVMELLEHKDFTDLFYYSSDLEGIDIDILQMFFSLGLRPKIISIEHNNDSLKLDSLSGLINAYHYVEIFPGIFRNDLMMISKEIADIYGIKSKSKNRSSRIKLSTFFSRLRW